MARPDENGKITCTGCDRTLPGDEKHFHRHRDAFKPKCKECRGASFGVAQPNKVYDAKEGHKFCSSCSKELPATDDYFFNGGKDKDGLTSQCKQCQSDVDYGTQKPNYNRDDGMWQCVECGDTYERTQENFYTGGDPEGAGTPTDGLMVYCKSCHTQRTNQSRRELENNVENTLTQKQWKAVCKEWHGECAYCGASPETLERDHVVPLKSGGDTKIENIVPACPSCNRSKGHKSISEWYAKQPFYDKTREAKIIHVNYGRY